MKGYIFLFTIILFSVTGSTQKVTASADKEKILIGEQFHLRLQANFNEGEAFDFFVIDTIPRFEILDRSTIDTSKFDGGLALVQELTMTSWDSGRIQIPAFVLDGERTKPLIIDVAYSPHPFDTTQPYHDVHEILDIKRPIETTWYWYLIGLLILILLFLLFFPRGKPKPKGGFVSDESAYKKTIKKLTALQNKTEAEDKLFYSELVQIFREYLHRRMNMYSFSKTTGDLSVQMEKLEMDRDQYLNMVQTLVLSDMAKYAKYQSTTEEKKGAVDGIRESVMAIENIYIINLKPKPSRL